LTKLPVISGKKLAKALEKAGFIPVRQKGSHLRMKMSVSGETINITIPLHDMVSKGTLRGIIKDAGLTVEELEKLMK